MYLSPYLPYLSAGLVADVLHARCSGICSRRCHGTISHPLFFARVAHSIHQKFCEGVAEVLSMPYYTLTAHELSTSVVSALLNMSGIPASAVALYLLRGLAQHLPQVGLALAFPHEQFHS